MKRLSLLAAVAVLLAGCAHPSVPAPRLSAAAPATSPKAFEGGWEGEMEDDPWHQFITLRIAPPGGDAPGTFGILFRTLNLRSVEQDGDVLVATIGSGEGAVTIRGEIQDGLLVGTLTQRGRVQPFTLRRIPEYPPPANRMEAWSQDLDTLATRFLAADRSFTPGRSAAFLEALEDIRRDLARLNDAQVTTRIAAAIALADNAHTRLYLLRNATELRRLPIRLWWFSDGLYVVRAHSQHAHLLGCRIDDIAGTSVRHARDRVAPLFAGNPYWTDYKTVYSLTSPEALHGVGLIPDSEAVEFGVADCAGPPRRTVRPLPLVRSQRTVEAWWDLSPRFRAPGEDWVQALDPIVARLPLHLRHDDNYWFAHQPESGLLYLQFNRSDHQPDENTSAFGERLLAELDRLRPRAFVLDLRYNTGGNLSLAEQLMKQLEERTRGMRRFVITSRATFSAGISQAVAWREAADVVFVGEPPGDTLDHWGEGGLIELPNSRYEANFTNGLHSYSPAPCPADVPCRDRNVPDLGPDIRVSVSWSEYRAGRDPAMEAILAALRRGD